MTDSNNDRPTTGIADNKSALQPDIDDTLASLIPYCRCIETGKLAFGKAQISKNLAFFAGEDKNDAEQLAKALKAMLGTKPAGQTNTVLVSHSGNLQDAAQIFPKPEGVTMIFKPQGNGAFEFVRRVEAQHWLQIAEKAGVAVDAGNKLSAKLPARSELCQNNDPKTNNRESSCAVREIIDESLTALSLR